MEPERDLRVGLRRQRDAPRAGDRQARRRGVDVAAQLLAAERQRAGDLADAFFGDEQIVDAEPDVVARRVERAAAAGGELGEARQRRARIRQKASRSTGMRRPSALNEYVESQPTNAAPVTVPALGDREVVEPHARAVEPQRRRRLLKRLAVRDAVVDRHAAEADGPLVLAGQMELAGQQAGHRIVVDLERVPQAVEVAARDAEPRVDLLAAVVARIAEREEAVGANLRVAQPHDAVASRSRTGSRRRCAPSRRPRACPTRADPRR